MNDVTKRIHDYALEDIMGDSFEKYARTIILDRALPDVRDGLKPVQRRILFSMYKDGNTYEKPTRKSAKAVGNIMGLYHPHGDSSIYDALVRMSQWWKNNVCYIEMQGNNGSMDGDGAAAMRYTETRLSKIANELLKDINKETVLMSLNYDDTLLEPTVLPAKFPNLLVNGGMGISAGYATNIPPHNLGEVIDATIKRIDGPNCRLDTIMEIIIGPDFPTGGIAEGKEGIREAFNTGRGKVTIKSKFIIEGTKNKRQIIITEIPYEVNKASLVKKIDEIRIDKKIEGLAEVRDESAKEVRIVVDLKKDANEELIINYLLKNTELMVSYSYNMVAIVNRRPMTVGILEILDAYIAHQKDVITKRTEFDLKRAENEMHIVEGLIKALEILDEVIRVIRASKNKSDAIENLVAEFEFTKLQAEAIVNLQLYKLTNTDVTELQERLEELKKNIAIWKQILGNEEALKHVMKTELKLVKKEYATERKTEIKEEVTEVKINTTSLIPKEDCMAIVTKEGYVKRVSMRSYGASDEETGLKDKDYVIGLYEANTMDTLLVFTDLGNFLYIPVHELPDLKWKELGKHVSNIINVSGENVIGSYLVKEGSRKGINFLTFTKNGMVKQTSLNDMQVQRYSKPINLMNLKGNDKVVSNVIAYNEIFITTYNGYGLRYMSNEVPLTGLKGSGVKSINLKDDHVVNGLSFSSASYIAVVTDKKTGKRIKIEEFEPISRARKGVLLVRDVKTNPYHILNSFVIKNKADLGIVTDTINYLKITELPICDRYQTGAQISKGNIVEAFIKKDVSSEEVDNEAKIDVSLDKVDEQIMTIDDFLGDLKID